MSSIVKETHVHNDGTRTASTSSFRKISLDQRFAAIQKRSDVCGGEPCVTGTRIAVRTIANLHSQGESAQELAKAFNLELWQVEEALNYANRNRETIARLIRENERA